MIFLLFCGLSVHAQEDFSEADFSRPLRTVITASPLQEASLVSINPSLLGNDLYPANSLLNALDLDRDLCRYYIAQYSSPSGLAWLRTIMKRAGPYLAFIRAEIRDRNLPEELLYLPVIESGYLASAVSSSGATGLWQFMSNSIAPFDIKVTDWVDERRDFWKSTQGALRKLEDNYRALGDWPLALAAYNAGLGAISGIVRQTGISNYWVLSERNQLRTETVHYVPKLLAASYILSNAREYGIVLWPENPDWTRIQIDRPVDLNLLAAAAGIDPAQLKMANRELNYDITPPERNYLLKVTAQDAPNVITALAGDLPLINYYIHTIRSGDTLLALASHYGITVDQITAMNPGVQARNLRIGSNLMIPALRDAPNMPIASANTLNFSGSYQVKQGDTLWSIARTHGITPEVLAEANGMAVNDILREGRVLKTPIR
ncbi:MAG: LysM peptidoglycan-binding domain-containing protein [Treponema sp.]|nr:LysM peptidoglycan-binding domain-containing protein [Treponema sp.]